MKNCNQCGKCCIKYGDGDLAATQEEITYGSNLTLRYSNTLKAAKYGSILSLAKDSNNAHFSKLSQSVYLKNQTDTHAVFT